VRAVLSVAALALAVVGVAQVSNAANIVRIGVNKIEFKWTAATGSPEGYLVSRSNKGGPLQAFAWVTEPRVEMPVVPGDQITITVAPGARNTAGTIFLGPTSAQSDRVWVIAAPTFPTGGEWLLRCPTCPSIAQRSLADASIVEAEVAAFNDKWKILGTAMLDGVNDALIWYNDSTGQLLAWDATDLMMIPGTLGTLPQGGLRPIGPADFDRDGIQEYVAQRTDNGQVVVIGLTSSGIRQVAAPFTPVGVELVAARDFTNDGKVDFIWRNTAARTLTMQSVLVDPKLNPVPSKLYGPAQTLATGLATDVAIASTGDYDGDGWLDLLLRSSTGQLSIMYLANGRVDGLADVVFQADDLSRFVVGSANIDGLPGDEIALQNGTTKEMALVFPANTTTTQRMKWLHPGPQWRAVRWDY
jgi:hypothetical protein